MKAAAASALVLTIVMMNGTGKINNGTNILYAVVVVPTNNSTRDTRYRDDDCIIVDCRIW